MVMLPKIDTPFGRLSRRCLEVQTEDHCLDVSGNGSFFKVIGKVRRSRSEDKSVIQIFSDSGNEYSRARGVLRESVNPRVRSA